MKKLLVLIFVFALAFTLKSEAKAVHGSFFIKFGIGDGNDGCVYVPFSVCSIGFSLTAMADSGDSGSQIMNFSGEVRNNMLVINLSKEISGKGNNSPGTYTFKVLRQIDLDADVAKELGFEKLSIATGNYEFTGRTISLKIISPRDPATGQSSGKRVLPTVNKIDMAIDEAGVQKKVRQK